MEIKSHIQADGDMSIMGQIISSVMASAPLVVASSILVIGLNSDRVDGYEAVDLLSRANHIGFQAISTISGLQSALDGKPNYSDLTGYVQKATPTTITADHNFTGSLVMPGGSYSNTSDGINVVRHFYPNGGNAAVATRANFRVWNGAGGYLGFVIDGNGSVTWKGVAIPTLADVMAHLATDINYNLSPIHYRNMYSTSNTAYTSYYPLGGNGAANSYGIMRAWDAAAGGPRNLLIGGDGTFTWGGNNVITAPLLATALTAKENSFLKGDLIQGTGITFSGSGVGRLYGAGNITINATGGIAGSGTVGYYPKFIGSSAIGNGDIFQDTYYLTSNKPFAVRGSAGTTWTASLDTSPGAAILALGDSATSKFAFLNYGGTDFLLTLSGGQPFVFYKTGRFSVQAPTGVAPFEIYSTTKVTNLNVDYLDDQDGTYYLNRVNHTGVQIISTISGLQSALDGKASYTDLAGYVSKITAATISANHNFTGTLSMPGVEHSNTLDGTNVYRNYIPDGGNGASITIANLRTWNGAGGYKSLRFGGDGVLTWDGNAVILATRTISTGTGLTGGGDLSVNRTWSVVFGSTTGTVAEGNHAHTFASLTSKPNNLAGYGIIDAVSTSDLSSYVRKDVQATISASHIFTNTDLTLPTIYHRQLLSNIAYVNHYPVGGNGASNSFAQLRVWDAAAGSNKAFAFGGDGSLTWAGANIALQSWVLSQGYKSSISSGDVTGALGYTPYNSSNPNGYIASINSGMVVSALGYTPYSNANPSGFIASINSSMVTGALGYTPMRDDRYITFNGTNYYINSNPNIGSSSGGVTGSGSFGMIPVWFGSSVLSSSDLYYNGFVYGFGGFTSSYHKVTATGGFFVSDVSTSSSSEFVLEVASTTRISRPWPTMTQSQRLSASVKEGGAVWQSDAGTYGVGLYLYYGGWLKVSFTLAP